MEKCEKVQYFEWFRTIAAMAVVFLHVFHGILATTTVKKVGVSVAATYSAIEIIFTRWAVPIFFMISGALLLDPRRRFDGKKYLTYIIRMLVVLLIFGLTYCLIELFFDGERGLPALRDALFNLFADKSWAHMWYIYALIGLYLWLPILRPYVKESSRRMQGAILLALFICTICFYSINRLLHIKIFNFMLVDCSLFYFLFGYYLHRYVKVNKAIIGLGIAGVGIQLFGTLHKIIIHHTLGMSFYVPASPFVVAYSMMIFLLGKKYLTKPIKESPIAFYIAELSFGIYLIHPVFINIFYKKLGWFPYNHLCPVIFELLIFIVSLVSSALLTAILKQIPGMKKIL